MPSHPLVPDWIFDPALPSQSRSGGNAAEYAFTPQIDTFVREVVQNSLDNAKSDPVKIVFRLVCLEGGSIAAFLKALRWDQLEPHILACAELDTGRRWKQALDRISFENRLVLMIVEDSNTVGLTGDESDKSNFAALCRHTLYSHKSQADAGGSYGLGKAVLWRFSGLSTVLFNSMLLGDDPVGQESPRFIGRAEFPWHKIGIQAFNGSGWMGAREHATEGDWAVSLWGSAAINVAIPVHAGRDGGETGTSIVVVGFQDPTSEGNQGPQEIAEEIIRAVSLNFWPSLVKASLEVSVEIFDADRGERIFQQRAVPDARVKAYADAFNAYRNGATSQELRVPGDTMAVPIPLSVPAKRDGSALQIQSEATLIVRLANEDAVGDNLQTNCAAFFRGPGMVIKYKCFPNLATTPRPFHAFVVCGRARRNPSDEDGALEEFLRLAEPPSHDNWDVTPRVKEEYKAGFKKLIDELERQIREQLKKVISTPPPPGQDGPELLRRMFPFGAAGGTGGQRPLFTYSGLSAELADDGSWVFRGEISASAEVVSSWQASIDVKFKGEDGGDSQGGIVEQLKSNVGKVTVDDGVGVIALPKGRKTVAFEGRTDLDRHPIKSTRATVALEIECRTSGGR